MIAPNTTVQKLLSAKLQPSHIRGGVGREIERGRSVIACVAVIVGQLENSEELIDYRV